jgi:hypothetical protein
MEHFTLCPVLTLEADKLDFVQRDGDLLFVFDEVRRYLGGEPPKAHQPLLL